ncbi:response regulator transcription factor [Pseudomonas sp. ANT_J12]|jgi:two-component system response regulator EvgA|uniref:response regulator transcription factor n=1 Tax=Pseudomonas sp. ANT_J12 TaxID=2597351 RepID=UPI0011F1BCCE|nr:response regulator transcription factor [Pseudomonas sp. ANT_J12]KAA0982994.1 response regulator transcription factor [Pseudomonas sp. ANT_J12]
MKVLIVDDHAVVRMAVGMILTREGHEIVGECENGMEAISKTLELKPDVIVLDLDIPLIDGMSVINRIKASPVRTRILVYTSMKNPVYATQCLRAGAAAFLSKVGQPGEIIAALQAIASGKSYFPIDTMDSVRRSDFAEDDEQLLKRLSRRELRVLLGLAQGKSNMLIAREMLLSNKTISTYKTRVMQKLNNATLLEMVEFARRNQLI